MNTICSFLNGPRAPNNHIVNRVGLNSSTYIYHRQHMMDDRQLRIIKPEIKIVIKLEKTFTFVLSISLSSMEVISKSVPKMIRISEMLILNCSVIGGQLVSHFMDQKCLQFIVDRSICMEPLIDLHGQD